MLLSKAASGLSESARRAPGGLPRLWWVGGGVALAAIMAIALATSGDAPVPLTTSTERAITASPAPSNVPVADVIPRETAGEVVSFATADSKREAAAAYAKGDYATALTQLEAAVTASPRDPEARNNLGQLFVREGRAAEALPHFDEAVRLDGQQWSYRFNRARAYGLLDRWPEAIADYRLATILFPGDHATLYNLGLALMRIKDYPGAVTAFEQAVAAAPDEHDFLITLGTAYVGTGQSDRARDTFERFLDVAPDDSEAPRVKALLEALAAAASQ